MRHVRFARAIVDLFGTFELPGEGAANRIADRRPVDVHERAGAGLEVIDLNGVVATGELNVLEGPRRGGRLQVVTVDVDLDRVVGGGVKLVGAGVEVDHPAPPGGEVGRPCAQA